MTEYKEDVEKLANPIYDGEEEKLKDLPLILAYNLKLKLKEMDGK